jgi:hypothetical protein
MAAKTSTKTSTKPKPKAAKPAKSAKGKPKKTKRTPESPWFIVAIVLGTLLFTAVLALAFLAGRSSRTPTIMWPQGQGGEGVPDISGLDPSYSGSIELRDGSDGRVYLATSNQVVQAAAQTYTNAMEYTDTSFTNTWNAAQKWVFTLTDGTVITNEVLTRGVQ